MAAVLIVDDSKTDSHFVGGMLRRHGHDPLYAANGEEGVLQARERHPDLILMDIVMPGMNGFQAIRRLRRMPETSTIPVVVVSCKDQDSDKVWARQQGAVDYVTKPVDEASLLASIDGALART
jgi:twitching motility two-component system response regulator PilH